MNQIQFKKKKLYRFMGESDEESYKKYDEFTFENTCLRCSNE